MPYYRQDQLSLNFPRISITLSSGATTKVSSFCGLGVTATTALSRICCRMKKCRGRGWMKFGG